MTKFAEPVWPNAGVESWYRTKLQTIVYKMAQQLLYAVNTAFADGAGGMAQDVKKMSARPQSVPTLLNRAMNRWGTSWTKRIEGMSETIARDFATKNRSATERAMMAKLAKAGFAVNFKPNKRVTQAYNNVVEWNVSLIKSIPQEFLKDVQADVHISVMTGGDLATLTEKLHEHYGVAWRRAEFIAQDQNAKAKAAIEKAQRLEVGITKAKWLHSHGGKVPRPVHINILNNKVYDIREGAYDKDEGEWIWPGQLPKCKCVDAAVIPGFES